MNVTFDTRINNLINEMGWRDGEYLQVCVYDPLTGEVISETVISYKNYLYLKLIGEL